eukprot:scaffold4587_cov182-Amphora_coffeaeformis.AAC.13
MMSVSVRKMQTVYGIMVWYGTESQKTARRERGKRNLRRASPTWDQRRVVLPFTNAFRNERESSLGMAMGMAQDGIVPYPTHLANVAQF